MPRKSIFIRVFIARPKDAENEAKIVKEVCDILSKSSNDEVIIKGYDFKDLPSSGGHPQDTINKTLANACDITMYILNKSIGGRGFSTEVRIGLRRWKEEKIPFMFYIRHQQLSKDDKAKRAAFLRRIDNKALYKEFNTDDEFKNLLFEHLSIQSKKIVASFESDNKNDQQSQTENASPEKKVNKPATKAEKSVVKTEDENILPEIMIKSAEHINSNANLDQFESVRLYLYSASILFDKDIGSEVLDNHVINLLYKHKEKIKPVKEEIRLLFRTLISDRYHQRAGWYWFTHINVFKVILYYSITLFTDDLSEDVKLGALTIMDDFWEEDFCKVVKKNISTATDTVKQQVIDVLKRHPSEDSLKIVEILMNDASSDIADNAYDARLSILTEIDVHRAVEVIISDEDMKSYKINSKVYQNAYDNELHRLLNHKEEFIRGDAFEELVKRSKIPTEKLLSSLQSKHWVIRFLSIKALVEIKLINNPYLVSSLVHSKNRPFFSLVNYKEDDVIKTIYNRTPIDKITEFIKWDYHGSIAYEIYGMKNWEAYKGEIRSDLNDKFKKRKKAIISDTAKKEDVSETEIEKRTEEYGHFITKMFIQAGLEVLLQKGGAADKAIAYLLINEDEYKISELCKQIIMKYGTKEDSLFLYNLAIKENRVNSSLLLRSLDLDKNNEHNLIHKGMHSGNNSVIKIIIGYCFKNKIKINEDEKTFIISLLHDSDYSLRELICTYIINTYTIKKLKKLLTEYTNLTNYYYNVVSYLDLYIFGHSKIKKVVFQKLTDKLLKQAN